MADPRSRRARILLNLQRQLETITTANSYATNVYKVTLDVRNWHETPEAETPTIYIVDENTTHIYHAGRTLEKEWSVALFGVMRGKTQYQMEELIADIEECLFKNITLSFDGVQPGPVSHMRITDVTTDNQLFSQIENTQLFKITLNIKFVGCVENPR